MAKTDLKSVDAIYNGRKISGIYRRQTGTFEAKKGAVKIIVPEYEYWLDFTVAGKRYRSVFGKESDFGRIGATGKWESHAVERAVEALVRFRENAKGGAGPTSIREEQALARQAKEERRRRERRQKTVAELAEMFLADIGVVAPNIKTTKPRTIREYRLNLHRDVIPAIGTRKAKTIEREDFAEIIGKVVKRGKIVQANRTLAACSRLFNWALSKGLVLYNPCAMMRKYEEKPRERVLTEPEQKEAPTEKARHEEIKALWPRLTEQGEQTEAKILLLCMLTGARPGEICNMRWEDIDGSWWTLSEEETKTGVTLDCYLTPTALAIIGTRREKGFVFTLASDSDRALPEDRLSRFVRKQHQYFSLEPWQPRDLRRTFTTLAKGFGYSDLIVNKAQARKDSSVIRTHYDKRRYYDELRQLFEAVEREILRIIGQQGETAKVIRLR
jgi:integrase